MRQSRSAAYLDYEPNKSTRSIRPGTVIVDLDGGVREHNVVATLTGCSELRMLLFVLVDQRLHQHAKWDSDAARVQESHLCLVSAVYVDWG